MAEAREENHEKKLEETGAPTVDSELSDADFEKVSGGGVSNTLDPSTVHPCKHKP